MTVEVDLVKFAVILLIISAIVLIVYLIKVISKLNKTVDDINLLLDSNKDNLNKSINTFPEICDNVNDITKSIKGKTDIVDNYFDRGAEAAAGLDLQSIATSVSSIVDIVSELKYIFSNRSKKRNR